MKVKAKTKLSHRSLHRSSKMVQTTICFPIELRPFVLEESGKSYPGSVQPMGVSRWVQKLIIEDRDRKMAKSTR